MRIFSESVLSPWWPWLLCCWHCYLWRCSTEVLNTCAHERSQGVCSSPRHAECLVSQHSASSGILHVVSAARHSLLTRLQKIHRQCSVPVRCQAAVTPMPRGGCISMLHQGGALCVYRNERIKHAAVCRTAWPKAHGQCGRREAVSLLLAEKPASDNF